MTGVVFPPNLTPKSVMFHTDIPSSSGGPTYTGAEQVVFSSAGRWRASVAFEPIRMHGNPNEILAARAIVAHLKGRSNTIYIGPYDCGYVPSALAGGASGMIGGIPHSDGSFFSDGSGYSQPSSPAVVAVSASEGDVAMSVTMIDATQSAQAGQYFGFGDNELYLIETSVDNGGGNFALTFWPPLRSDHGASDEVNFSAPKCEMRLSQDNSAELTLRSFRYGSQQYDLVEAL